MNYVLPEDDHYQIELYSAKRKSLLTGLIVGFLLSLVLISSSALFLWLNKETVMEKTLDHIASHYMKELFSTFPDGYVSNNQHKILPILDAFTNAAAAKKVSEKEFKKIGKFLMLSLKDKKLTYEELTNILAKMENASKRGNNL